MAVRVYGVDNDEGPLRDGDVLSVPLALADAAPRFGVEDDDASDGALPVFVDAYGREFASAEAMRARRLADEARQRRIERMCDAWRHPSPSPVLDARSPPAVRPDNMSGAARPAISSSDISAARAAADAAWERKRQRIENAWRMGK